MRKGFWKRFMTCALVATVVTVSAPAEAQAAVKFPEVKTTSSVSVQSTFTNILATIKGALVNADQKKEVAARYFLLKKDATKPTGNKPDSSKNYDFVGTGKVCGDVKIVNDPTQVSGMLTSIPEYDLTDFGYTQKEIDDWGLKIEWYRTTKNGSRWHVDGEVIKTKVPDTTLPTITVKTGEGETLGNVNANVFRKVSFKLYDAGKIDKAEVYRIEGDTKTLVDKKDLTDCTWSDWNYFSSSDGKYEIVAYDVAGNAASYPFTIDKTAPTIKVAWDKMWNGTVDKTVGNESLAIYSKVSFKLYDAGKIDKAEVYHITDAGRELVSAKDLTDNTWSDFNAFRSSTGKYVIVAYDVAGNTSEYEFTIDATAPDITVKVDQKHSDGTPGTYGDIENDIYEEVSFKLHDNTKVDRADIYRITEDGQEVLVESKDLTDNSWSDWNFVNAGRNYECGKYVIKATDIAGNVGCYYFEIAKVFYDYSIEHYFMNVDEDEDFVLNEEYTISGTSKDSIAVKTHATSSYVMQKVTINGLEFDITGLDTKKAIEFAINVKNYADADDLDIKVYYSWTPWYSFEATNIYAGYGDIESWTEDNKHGYCRDNVTVQSNNVPVSNATGMEYVLSKVVLKEKIKGEWIETEILAADIEGGIYTYKSHNCGFKIEMYYDVVIPQEETMSAVFYLIKAEYERPEDGNVASDPTYKYNKIGRGTVLASEEEYNDSEKLATTLREVPSYDLTNYGYTEEEIAKYGLVIKWYRLIKEPDGWHVDGEVVATIEVDESEETEDAAEETEETVVETEDDVEETEEVVEEPAETEETEEAEESEEATEETEAVEESEETEESEDATQTEETAAEAVEETEETEETTVDIIPETEKDIVAETSAEEEVAE